MQVSKENKYHQLSVWQLQIDREIVEKWLKSR